MAGSNGLLPGFEVRYSTSDVYLATVEPPYKGHFGATILSLVEKLSLSRM